MNKVFAFGDDGLFRN